MPLKKGVKASVNELLNSTTFLESLSPKERTDIFSAARHSSLPASPDVRHHGVGTAWEDNKHAYEHWQNPDDGLHMQLLQRPVTADAIPAVRQAFDALEALQQYPPHVQLLDSMESEQLLKRNQLLQQQKSQLQAKITSLQYQVSMLLANHKAAESQGNERLAALETVITRLQTTMTDVGATAARVAQENKVLSAENRQLTAERVKHLEIMQQLKAHCRGLEAELLTRVTTTNQQAAEAAALAASPLNELLTPALLAATAPPPGANITSNNSMLDTSNSKIVPALQEIATLKRLQDSLQKQVARLQQQLSAAESEAQAAASTAAAERARSQRMLNKGQQQIAAAVQRLQHMADKEQQQQLAMQETLHHLSRNLAMQRDKYIAKLEQCLLDQHQQLTDRAIATAAATVAASRSPIRRQSDSGNKAVVASLAPASIQGLIRSSCPGAFNIQHPAPDQQQHHGQQQRAGPVLHDAPGLPATGIGLVAAAHRVGAGSHATPQAAAAALSAAAERLLSHDGHPAQAEQHGPGSTAAAAPPAAVAVVRSPLAAAVVGSPDINAAKRSAMARQCVNVMLSGSPEGRLTVRAAAMVQEANAAAAAEHPAAVAARQQGVKPMPQQQANGLQHLQQSRFQHWQQRQLMPQQQQQPNAAASAGSAFSNGQSKPTASGAWEARKPGRQQQQKQQGAPLLSKQQQRQQRLRELLQKQQHTRPQQVKLRTAQAPQQQQPHQHHKQHQQPRQPATSQQPQQPTQQQRQQHRSGSEDGEYELEAEDEWHQLQQQIVQEQAAGQTTAWPSGVSGQREAEDNVRAAGARSAAVTDHSAAFAMQQVQHLHQQQQLQELLDDCSDDELSALELVTQSDGQQHIHNRGLRNQANGVSSNGRSVSEEQLVAQVLEMQHNMQLLEGQLLQLGCAP